VTFHFLVKYVSLIHMYILTSLSMYFDFLHMKHCKIYDTVAIIFCLSSEDKQCDGEV